MKVGLIVAMDIEYNKMLDALGGSTGRLANRSTIRMSLSVRVWREASTFRCR